MRKKAITQDQVAEMKELKNQGMDAKVIAKNMGVSVETVYMRIRGKERPRMERKNYRPRIKAKPGFFNEHEYENWLV